MVGLLTGVGFRLLLLCLFVRFGRGWDLDRGKCPEVDSVFRVDQDFPMVAQDRPKHADVQHDSGREEPGVATFAAEISVSGDRVRGMHDIPLVPERCREPIAHVCDDIK